MNRLPRGVHGERGGRNDYLVDYFKGGSPNSNYLLGLLWSDGSITKVGGTYRVGWGLSTRDRSLLEAVKVELGLEANVNDFTTFRNGTSCPCSNLFFCSKPLGEYLISECGIFPAKSHYDLPFSLPSENLGHRVRGCYDGDGSLDFSAKTPGFVFYGSRIFLHHLAQKLSSVLNVREAPVRPCGSIYKTAWYGSDSELIYDLMYPAGDYLFLSRKRPGGFGRG